MKEINILETILDELFEMFTFYRDFILRYDGDPFDYPKASNKLLDEGRENLLKTDHDKYKEGWSRFEELRQEYFRLRPKAKDKNE